ncbi:MAG: N-acetylneuraminate synthase, partial [Phototrophicales bacterium]
AQILEKHITLNRDMLGPDHAASMEPNDFQNYVKSVHSVESALGSGVKHPAPEEVNISRLARRSLVATCDIAQGTNLNEDCVACLRPGDGISASEYYDFLGKTLRVDVKRGAQFEPSMFR